MMTIEERVSRCERSAQRWRAGAIILAAGWMIAAGHREADDITVRNLTVTDTLMVGQDGQGGYIRMRPTALAGGQGATVEIWGVPGSDGVILEGRPNLGAVNAWAGGAIASMEADLQKGDDSGLAVFSAMMGESEARMFANRRRPLVVVRDATGTKAVHP